MAFLNSDLAKVIGAVLSAVAGTLLVNYPPPHVVGVVATIALSVLTGLGLISGGTRSAQPKPPVAPVP